MEYFVYIIHSVSKGTLYKGHCQNLEIRLAEHNAGKTKSTKFGIPWKLIYSETFESKELAIAREKYFKTAAGRRFIKFNLSLPTNLFKTTP